MLGSVSTQGSQDRCQPSECLLEKLGHLPHGPTLPLPREKLGAGVLCALTELSQKEGPRSMPAQTATCFPPRQLEHAGPASTTGLAKQELSFGELSC